MGLVKKLETYKKNVIFCFKGYHPFTTDNNKYAFCKINNNKFLKIKEKSSFTNNWTNEPLSIGLFYYTNSKNLFKSLEILKEKNIKTNNEYFPSQGFNFIKNKTVIKYVKNFIHLGKPFYYETYLDWLNFFTYQNIFKKIKTIKLADEIIIPAAGESKRFKDTGFKPKYLYVINSVKKELINFLFEYLPSQKKILLSKKRINKKNYK